MQDRLGIAGKAVITDLAQDALGIGLQQRGDFRGNEAGVAGPRIERRPGLSSETLLNLWNSRTDFQMLTASPE
jgi:hypothetical protein